MKELLEKMIEELTEKEWQFLRYACQVAAESPYKWTQELPTDPGWYWFYSGPPQGDEPSRGTVSINSDIEPVAVRLILDDDGQLARLTSIGPWREKGYGWWQKMLVPTPPAGRWVTAYRLG